MAPDNSSLHYRVIRHIIDHGHAPSLAQLSHSFECSEAAVRKQLRALADDHGVVLHPDGERIWVIHPFSLAPTGFLVSSNGRSWWGNCGWCSLGVAALLDGDVDIRTTAGAEGDPLTVSIRANEVTTSDVYVHFPIPMSQAWDNVIYTCSTMLYFKSKSDVDDWCRRHDIPRGDVQPIDTIWAFSKAWYGDHLNPNWKKWTVDEARELFSRFGLTHPVWQLPAAEERF